MKYKQYFATESEPISFAKVHSNTPVIAVLPEGYQSISAKQYRKLKWLERKFGIMERKDRFKQRAAKLKKAMTE